MMCHRMGRSPISTIGLGRDAVSSDRRVPRPPARMTTFTARPLPPDDQASTFARSVPAPNVVATATPSGDPQDLGVPVRRNRNRIGNERIWVLGVCVNEADAMHL